jgi:hypothetical protein
MPLTSPVAAYVAPLFEWMLALDPMRRTLAQIGDDHGQWGDTSNAGVQARQRFAASELAAIRERFGNAQLNEFDQRLFDVVVFDLEASLSAFEFAHETYAAVPTPGVLTEVTSVLAAIALHTPADYVARLEGLASEYADVRVRVSPRSCR